MLWHLKREVALAHLAQEALAWDRRAPAAWAILGNCFSLQKVRSHRLRCAPCAAGGLHHPRMEPRAPAMLTCCFSLQKARSALHPCASHAAAMLRFFFGVGLQTIWPLGPLV